MGIKNNFDVTGGFDELSQFYDSNELRFFLDSSKLMVKELDLTGVKNILDVATGTGHTAIELAKVLPNGNITGIDISQSMLEKAELKRRDLLNINFKKYNMECLASLGGKYDLVTCSFGTYFVKDIIHFFKSVSGKLNEDGQLAMLTFADQSFLPFNMFFLTDLDELGFIQKMPPLFATINNEYLHAINIAGLKKVKVIEKNLRYTIKTSAEWWRIVWGTAYRSFLTKLTAKNLAGFKEKHLKKVDTIISLGANTFEVNILIITGNN
jgi:ubiquinone/menaquinone biosynthesis C-methylase UbiE